MQSKTLSFGSVCSGIEAASAAWEPLGWNAAWFAEIEPFPCSVLAHQYPNVTNLGDMTAIAARVRDGSVEAPDILVGGTPCQAFSVAGARAGLADPRGQLTLAYVDLANAIDSARALRGEQPAITVWENVPGVLSSKDNAFGCFLGALAGEGCELQPPGGKWKDAGCVYGPQRAIAWRILDAQFFGLAQRRRRVFVVSSARKGFNPATVLFEFEGVRRDTPPSREAGEEFASRAARSVALRGRDGGATAELGDDASGCLRASSGGGDKPHVLAPTIAFSCKDHGADAGSLAPTLRSMNSVNSNQNAGGQVAVAYGIRTANTSSNGWGIQEELTHTLDTAHGIAVSKSLAVRRLTPRECERLQGFPDDYTLIPWRKKPASECPDGPRYKALGNSMAVPVMRWIGSRIHQDLFCLSQCVPSSPSRGRYQSRRLPPDSRAQPARPPRWLHRDRPRRDRARSLILI